MLFPITDQKTTKNNSSLKKLQPQKVSGQNLPTYRKLTHMLYLRSFGHQGALYYVFLASDPLKTSREYAVFALRILGPKVCTRETSRQTQRVSAFFCFDCAK